MAADPPYAGLSCEAIRINRAGSAGGAGHHPRTGQAHRPALAGHGQVWPGLALLVFAYGLSLVLIERTFDAGLPALLNWGWFRRGYEWFIGFRAAIMARIRALAWVQAVLSVAGWLRAQTAAMRAALAQLFTTLRGWLGPR